MWFSNSVLETILGWKWYFSRPLSGIIQFVRDQDGQLSDYMEWVNGTLHWKLVFIRGTRLGVGLNGSPKEGFTSRSYYRVLQASVEDTSLFPWKCVWKSLCPPGVSFYVWEVALGKILMTNNLWRRCFLLADWSCLCRSDGESVNHLQLHCPFVHDLWAFIFCLVRTNWVMPNSVEAMLKSWDGVRGVWRYVKVWRAEQACLTWCIWREHNQCTFEGKAFPA